MNSALRKTYFVMRYGRHCVCVYVFALQSHCICDDGGDDGDKYNPFSSLRFADLSTEVVPNFTAKRDEKVICSLTQSLPTHACMQDTRCFTTENCVVKFMRQTEHEVYDFLASSPRQSLRGWQARHNFLFLHPLPGSRRKCAIELLFHPYRCLLPPFFTSLTSFSFLSSVVHHFHERSYLLVFESSAHLKVLKVLMAASRVVADMRERIFLMAHGQVEETCIARCEMRHSQSCTYHTFVLKVIKWKPVYRRRHRILRYLFIVFPTNWRQKAFLIPSVRAKIKYRCVVDGKVRRAPCTVYNSPLH